MQRDLDRDRHSGAAGQPRRVRAGAHHTAPCRPARRRATPPSRHRATAPPRRTRGYGQPPGHAATRRRRGRAASASKIEGLEAATAGIRRQSTLARASRVDDRAPAAAGARRGGSQRDHSLARPARPRLLFQSRIEAAAVASELDQPRVRVGVAEHPRVAADCAATGGRAVDVHEGRSRAAAGRAGHDPGSSPRRRGPGPRRRKATRCR